MDNAETLLQRLAHSLEQGLNPFLMENTRLASLSAEAIHAKNPEPRYALTQSVWLDHVANSGVELEIIPPEDSAEGLRLKLDDMGQTPWFTLSYDLPITALREGRHFGQLLGLSGDGPVRVRACLRYLLPEGFRDVHSRNILVLTSGSVEELMFMPIDPKLASEATGAQALLFFEARSFDIKLDAIEALLV